MKTILRLLLLSVSSASILQAAVAAPPPVALENEPLHLRSCPMPSAGDWTETTSVQAFGEQGVAVYQAGYRPDGSGSLKKRQAGQQTEAEWDAGVLLTGRSDARKLWTANGGGDKFGGIPFVWTSLDAAQKLALDRSPVDGSDDGLGQKRLNYLRGVRTDEASLFRRRQRLLGAIVHGVPVFAGTSSTAAGDVHVHGDAYRERPEVVYVGAGDGMLHAFDAKSGDELFAYLPHAVFDRLPLLTTVDSTDALPVDGGIGIGDVPADLAGNRWCSTLVAGMGRGAQGVVALDVTAPTEFDSNDVRWEFTDADDADIGNVIGTPAVAKFRTGLLHSVPQYRYFAVVPGGVNNHIADGDSRFNPAGKAALFLLALDKPANEPWRVGVNYFKFVLPASDAGRANGVIELALAMAPDGSASVAYAGDLLGNLWRFDFGGNTPDSHSPQLLFVARDAAGNRQPITQRPRIVFAPERGYMVLFGTGKYLERRDLDRSAYASQSFYGIWDRDGARIDGRGSLVARSVQPQGDRYTIVGEALMYVPAGRRGWYLDFPQSERTGERSIASATMLDTQLMFGTLIPASSACVPPLGHIYLLDALTGLPVSAHFGAVLSEASFPGIPPPFFVMPVETSERDATGKRRVVTRMRRTAAEKANSDTNAPSDETIVEAVTTAGRLSWREIIDWQELRSER
ncbi:MAG TPA: PilC/PilY family type IV pilus protein [Oxalicibacterium sp.]|nr:PilC/PilY family type IV pilus protein [Oxalicibacterium sp.]